MAPEQFEGKPVSEKVDVWSFGVLLWECLTQAQPWKDLSPMQIIYAVGLQGERLPLPPDCPPFLRGLLDACWQEAPEARPAISGVLAQLQGELRRLEGRGSVSICGLAEAAAAEGGSSSGADPQTHDQQPQLHPVLEQSCLEAGGEQGVAAAAAHSCSGGADGGHDPGSSGAALAEGSNACTGGGGAEELGAATARVVVVVAAAAAGAESASSGGGGGGKASGPGDQQASAAGEDALHLHLTAC